MSSGIVLGARTGDRSPIGQSRDFQYPMKFRNIGRLFIISLSCSVSIEMEFNNSISCLRVLFLVSDNSVTNCDKISSLLSTLVRQ